MIVNRYLWILLIVVLALTLGGCGTQQQQYRLPDPPKPTIDYRLLERCDTKIPDVAPTIDMQPFLENHNLVVAKLDACACRNITLRNLACQFVANKPCAQIPECKGNLDAK